MTDTKDTKYTKDTSDNSSEDSEDSKSGSKDINGVWIFCVTENVDDYKTRGESPRSNNTVCRSEKECCDHLFAFMLEKLRTIFNNGCGNNKLTEYRKRYFDRKLVKCAPNDWQSNNCDNEEFTEKLYVIKEFNKKIKKLMENDYDTIYDIIAKGEFIPYKWTYTIGFENFADPVGTVIKDHDYDIISMEDIPGSGEDSDSEED